MSQECIKNQNQKMGGGVVTYQRKDEGHKNVVTWIAETLKKGSGLNNSLTSLTGCNRAKKVWSKVVRSPLNLCAIQTRYDIPSSQLPT